MPIRTGIPRYGALLFCLILFIMVIPLLPEDFPPYFIEVAFSLILLTGLFPIISESSSRFHLSLFTIAVFALRWLVYLEPAGFFAEITASTATIIWLLIISILMPLSTFNKYKISIDTIFSSVIVYFLIIILFSEIYNIIYLFSSENFSGIASNRVSASMIFFSMSSMSGTESGAITANSKFSLSMSLFQSIFGQFYIALVVAWVIGQRIANPEG